LTSAVQGQLRQHRLFFKNSETLAFDVANLCNPHSGDSETGRQEDYEYKASEYKASKFQASLGCRVRLFLKKN
jgi:hypothetical protein